MVFTAPHYSALTIYILTTFIRQVQQRSNLKINKLSVKQCKKMSAEKELIAVLNTVI